MILNSETQRCPATACSICKKKASGFWDGSDIVQVCRACAVRILPALIADATWSPHWTPEIGARDLLVIEVAFWHAQKLNTLRDGNAQSDAFHQPFAAKSQLRSSNDKGGANV